MQSTSNLVVGCTLHRQADRARSTEPSNGKDYQSRNAAITMMVERPRPRAEARIYERLGASRPRRAAKKLGNA